MTFALSLKIRVGCAGAVAAPHGQRVRETLFVFRSVIDLWGMFHHQNSWWRLIHGLLSPLD